jgi:hypothetical protein
MGAFGRLLRYFGRKERMDEKRLLEIEARHKKARKGPWRIFPSNKVIDGNGQVILVCVVPDDRAFLCESWMDVRDLVEEVKALRKKYRVGLDEAADKIAAVPKKPAKKLEAAP